MDGDARNPSSWKSKEPPQLGGDLRQRVPVPRLDNNTSSTKGPNQKVGGQKALASSSTGGGLNGNNNNNNNAAHESHRQILHGHKPHEQQHYLLPRMLPSDAHKKCLIVDLDETLVHSSFKPVKNADFVIPVEIDNVVHQVYVLKRPHTDHFLERIGALFECILFTASLAKYADPVADLLDKRRIFRTRLFREACVFYEGNYVKDLERLGRDLRKVIIIDNSPASYAFHPDNAVAVRTWFDDPNDTELLDLLPMLEELSQADDIYSVLGTVPPHQHPRCLTPSDDLIKPPPMASSSPITQVLPPGQQPNSGNNNNGGGGGGVQQQMQQQPSWKRKARDNRFGLNSPTAGEMRRAVTLETVPSTTSARR